MASRVLWRKANTAAVLKNVKNIGYARLPTPYFVLWELLISPLTLSKPHRSLVENPGIR